MSSSRNGREHKDEPDFDFQTWPAITVGCFVLTCAVAFVILAVYQWTR